MERGGGEDDAHRRSRGDALPTKLVIGQSDTLPQLGRTVNVTLGLLPRRREWCVDTL